MDNGFSSIPDLESSSNCPSSINRVSMNNNENFSPVVFVNNNIGMCNAILSFN